MTPAKTEHYADIARGLSQPFSRAEFALIAFGKSEGRILSSAATILRELEADGVLSKLGSDEYAVCSHEERAPQAPAQHAAHPAHQPPIPPPPIPPPPLQATWPPQPPIPPEAVPWIIEAWFGQDMAHWLRDTWGRLLRFDGFNWRPWP